MKFEFLVQGRESTPYKVVFEQIGKALMATCSCAASSMGQLCKHRLRIIQGLSEDVVSNNLSEIKKINELYKNSEVSRILELRQQREDEIENIKKDIKLLNKRISQALKESA